MIPKVIIQEYLNRPLDTHVWVKSLGTEELQHAINALKPRPKLYPGLKRHQLACFLLGVAHPQFAYWLDMGTGKSLITLELLRYWWQVKRLRRAIIFITSDKAFPTWEKQIARFNIDVPYVTLEGSSTEKWRALDEFEDGLILVSYPGAVHMTSVEIEVKGKGKRKKRKMVLDPKLVDRLCTNLDAIVMDESTRASGHQSLTHKLMDKLGSRAARIRYALAGRPFGRDPTLLWAQHYLIDRGETLGETLGLFREAFFTSAPNRWVNPYRAQYIREYTFDKRKQPLLARMIQHRSITYGAEECIDLPSHVSVIEEVKFPAEAREYHRLAIEKIIASKGNMREIKNVFLRMRQLSSGFIGFVDDETGERAQIEFDDNPKFDRLFELLEEMPQDRKAVVFYEFTHSGRKIFNAAQSYKPIWLWSGTKDYKRDLHNFENKPEYRLAVVNNKVGAFSLDGLQVANYCVFYESPVSNIDREQAERRLRRQGQTRKVFQYDLIVKGSVDAKILKFHAEGQSLLNTLLRRPALITEKDDG